METRNFLRKVNFFYKQFLKKFSISWSCILLATVFTMIFPYSTGKIIDYIYANNYELAYAWAWLSIVSFFIPNVLLFNLRQKFEIKNLDYAVDRELRCHSLNKMNELSIGQHKDQNSGIKQDVVLSGSNSLMELNSLLINNISFLILRIVISLVLFVFFCPVIFLINLSYLSAYIALSVHFNHKNAGKLDDMIKQRNSSQKKYTDFIRNITLFLLNSNEKTGMNLYNKQREKYELSATSYWINCVNFLSFGNLLEGISTALVLFYCIYLASKGTISGGEVMIYLMWSKMVSGSMESFNNIYRHLIRLFIDVKKFFHFLDIEGEILPPKNEVTIKDLKGGIKFQNVDFEYPAWKYFEQFETDDNEAPKITKAKKIIKNLSFTIMPKEKVAFVGMSGAGKSTIISLIMRAYDPQSGSVLIDGTDIRDMDPRKLRRQIGLVEQDIQLMDDTLRTNLLIGLNGDSESINDEELWEVIRKANIDKFEDKLPNGLDTNIGERGIKLSGGERQRVAIARALLKKAPIIIFDEATSNLDGINEQEIHEAMFEAGENSTCIFIAHRLATVKNVDKIFVIHDGQIIAEGKHQELVKNCEIYKELVQRQVVTF